MMKHISHSIYYKKYIIQYSTKNHSIIFNLIHLLEDMLNKELIDDEKCNFTICDEFHLSISRLVNIKKALYQPLCNSIFEKFKSENW